MTGGQKITLGLGVALALASLWRGQQIQELWKILSNQGSDQLLPVLKNIGIDVVFLIIVTWLAGLSDDTSKITGALLVGLWLLFLMQPSGQAHQQKTVLPIINLRGV